MQPLEPGPCTKFIDRHYFDVTTRKCMKFSYGGCRGRASDLLSIGLVSIRSLGNENNFMTHDECEAMCDELIQDHRPGTLSTEPSSRSFSSLLSISNE